MTSESYMPGHIQNAVDFMSKRSLQSHGGFFTPYLKRGVSVLDCGCGPGTITLDIAAQVEPGLVIGVDFEQSQIDLATTNANNRGLGNVAFQCTNCYSLPFGSEKFDRVFSHALMEHIPDPACVLAEMFRVLKPGGIIGICSPDWGGFLLSPPSPELSNAVDAYMKLQSKSGGDVEIGKKLGLHLAAAGFREIRMSARYECYGSPGFIGEYLALQLECAGDTHSAGTFRAWSEGEACMFAQAWVSAVAMKP